MKLIAQIACALALAGCGGGSGTTTSPPIVLDLSGTAASGIAMSSATIAAKCKGGSGTAVSAVDGKYKIAIPGATLPCFIQATDPGNGRQLHSFAIGSGAAAVANITPITEMLAARALNIEPSVFFGAFNEAALLVKFTPATLSAAQSDIANVLVSMVDIGLDTDYLAAPLTAATAANPAAGDAHDKLLDKLAAAVSAGQMRKLVTALANIGAVADIRALLNALLTNLPTANAGVPQSVFVGTPVTLDASASVTGAGATLSYSWTLAVRPAGSASALTGPAAVKPSFTPDVAGLYIAKLVVNDGNLNSIPVTVGITVSDGNAAPVARALVPAVVEVGRQFTLDGSGSSADTGRTILAFAWNFTAKPAGSTLSISDTDGHPIVIADVPGVYVVSLTVFDGHLQSAATTLTFEAVAADLTPASLTQLSGNAQMLTQHQQLPAPLTVQVRNTGGAAIAGIPVVFSAAGSDTVLPGGQVISDASGLATWRGYLHQAGQQHVLATVTGLPAVDFLVDVSAGGNPYDGIYHFTFVALPGHSPSLGQSRDVALAASTINVDPDRFPPQSSAFSETTGSLSFVIPVGIDLRYFVTGTLVMDPDGQVTGSGTVEENWMGNPRGMVSTWTAQRR